MVYEPLSMLENLKRTYSLYDYLESNSGHCKISLFINGPQKEYQRFIRLLNPQRFQKAYVYARVLSL